MEYLTLLNQLEEYYANLLIVQYNGKPKATETIKLLVNLVYINMILMQIRDGFNLATAVGSQLDIIGQWVGVSRDYIGASWWGKEYLSYPRYSDTTDTLQHGYSTYETFDDTGAVLTYNELRLQGATLNDEDYRVVIGLKIIKNSINHVCGEIDKAIWEFFAGQVYTTWEHTQNQLYKLKYNYPASLTTLINVCNDKNVLPTPTGVAITLGVIEE